MVEHATLWTFQGFVTEAGGKPVQQWYWNDLSVDDRDDIRLRIGYLADFERHLWKEPHFKNLGDIGEFRKKISRGPLRIYGYFSAPHVFLFLHGTIKKQDDDKEGKRTARLRLSRFNQGIGSAHEFDFQESPTPTNSTE